MKGNRDIAPFGLRMPAELRQKLVNAAEINGRSINAEILHRLEFSFGTENTKARLDALERALREKGLMT